MTTIKPALIAAAVVSATLAWSSTVHADGDQPPPCASAQDVVTALPLRVGAGHRGMPLLFSLAPEAGACTLTGYPGVDSGAGGPLIHAGRTLVAAQAAVVQAVDVPRYGVCR